MPRFMNNLVPVQQTNDTTCVQACIAMVSNTPIEEVIELVGSDKGMHMKHEEDALDALRMYWNRMNLPGLIPGNCHIVSVPSLHSKGVFHRIVIDVSPNMECDIYDPNEGREGKDVYTIETLKSWGEVVIVLPRLP